MKVITIQQPFASLVIMGVKKIETRSWSTRYRGPLLIHAAASMPNFNKWLCTQEPFIRYIQDLGELPLGKILGQVTIDSIINTSMLDDIAAKGIIHIPDVKTERAFGDYSPGRYGWYCIDPVAFKTPIPAKGQLGLWAFPDDQLPAESMVIKKTIPK
jgi:hypothetical protein